MDKMDSNSKIFMSLSIISWTLLLITGWMSFGVPKIDNGLGDKGTLFWLTDHINKDYAYSNSFDVYYILYNYNYYSYIDHCWFFNIYL